MPTNANKARPRPDFQTDYEDPTDRLFRRAERTTGGKPKKAANPVATVAYYLGVVALIPCVGSLLGPVAVLLGLIGVAKSSATVGGLGKAKSGLWFGVVASVLYIFIPLGFYIWIMTLR